VDLGEVVLSLLHKPAVFGASEGLGKSHGHFGRYAALVISSESVLPVTPIGTAAPVMVSPKGSLHWCKTTPPGCGGFSWSWLVPLSG